MTKDKPNILIDAEWDGLGEYLSEFLTDNDFKVTVIEENFDSEKIISELSRGTYAVVILTENCSPSKRWPDAAKQLLDAVSEVKRKCPKVYCVVMGGQHDIDFVIGLERRGSDDFFPLPFKTEYLLSRIEKAI